MKPSGIVSLACLLAGLTCAATDHASAAVWQWGCMGSSGGDQIAFNRKRLVVIAGQAPAGKLDEFVHGDELKPAGKGAVKAPSISATYQPADLNSGLDKAMSFAVENTANKLTLTELKSTKIASSSRLMFKCRDETVERFRKTYRLERDGQPAQTVTLICLEYQLSTRGGRKCQ